MVPLSVIDFGLPVYWKKTLGARNVGRFRFWGYNVESACRRLRSSSSKALT